MPNKFRWVSTVLSVVAIISSLVALGGLFGWFDGFWFDNPHCEFVGMKADMAGFASQTALDELTDRVDDIEAENIGERLDTLEGRDNLIAEMSSVLSQAAHTIQEAKDTTKDTNEAKDSVLKSLDDLKASVVAWATGESKTAEASETEESSVDETVDSEEGEEAPVDEAYPDGQATSIATIDVVEVTPEPTGAQ